MPSVSFKNRVKNSTIVYGLYYYIGSFIVSFLKLFLKPQNDLILFVSYGGKYFDDSPKDIYEAMLKDERYKNLRLVWAFTNPSKFDEVKGEKIKIDSITYYQTALQARVWITNVSMMRGLKFKGINALSLNSWHGSAIKYLGEDSISKDSFRSRDHGRRADIMLAQSGYDRYVFSRAFSIPIDNVMLTGFPRNDSLVSDNHLENIRHLKDKLLIPQNKKVILYAPTYRDYDKIEGNICYLEPHLDIDKWRSSFGDEYVLIIRAHMAISKVLGVKDDDFVRDFSGYPSLNDILLVTDILISDYSGILFDFSILGRPIICYTYDYDFYKEKRGMYMDIREELYSVSDEESLIESIRHMDIEKMREMTIKFREKFVEEYGYASRKVLDIIYRSIEN